MKNILTIFLTSFTLILLSCSGKNDRQDFKPDSYNGQIDINEINLKKRFKQFKYHPREYVEIVTDTIMNNGFRVKIKYYSLMDHSIKKSNSLTTKQEPIVFHRQFQSDIVVYKDERLVFQTTLNDKESIHFEKDILQFVSLDEMISNKEQVVINYGYHDISNNKFSDLRLYIKENGSVTTEKTQGI